MSNGPVVVVVGNPQAGSRTATAAALVGTRLAALIAAELIAANVNAADAAGSIDVELLDLATVGPNLFGWGDPAVQAAKQTVLGARALVVASPTYKASITGLLKAFLDQFGADELAGAVTIPVMSGGSAAHSLALEAHLRPVLVEIGASQPTRGIYFAGDEIDAPDAVIDRWSAAAEPVLRRIRWA